MAIRHPCSDARDDDQAELSGGWTEQEASYDQFGMTVQVASGESSATALYVPTLAYAGQYEVLAWVVPATGQSSQVPVTIRHAQGETVVLLNETSGEIGWHSLGKYMFNVGNELVG